MGETAYTLPMLLPMLEQNSHYGTEVDTKKNQESWGSKLEYLLSVLGNCVGYNNVWRFPYVCMKNGGGAFLIPYVFFILVCGIPLFYVEAAIAQYSGKSSYNVWEICPLFKGLGIGIFIMMFVICSYYNMISAWILYYFVNSFINPLPWMSCNNDWNTPYCTDDNHVTNVTDINNSYVDNNEANNSNLYLNHSQEVTPEEEFWSIHILDISPGIHDVGDINWYLVACLAVAWVAVYLAILLGVKSVGKVVYVTALSPYILLTIILIRGLTLPGSMDGVVYYLKPDFNKLRDFKVWIEAAVQMFYSLGPGWGGIITLACHNKFDNKFNRDAIFLSLAGEGTSIFGGFVTFSILGYMTFKLNVPVSKVAKTGPGLIFITYPEALSEIPIPNLWAVLFFLMMFFVGLDSQFVQLETIMAVVEDAKPILKKRKYRVVLRGVLCVTLLLIGLLYCTQGGIYFFQITDWYICSLFPFVIGILECVIIAWIYGIARFDSDVKAMLGNGASKFILFAICFVTPTLLSGVFLAVLVLYKPPTYGTYNYTEVAIGCGWLIGLSPVFAVLVVAVYTLITASGTNLKEKLKTSVTPSKTWTQVSQVELRRKSSISSMQFWKLKFQKNT